MLPQGTRLLVANSCIYILMTNDYTLLSYPKVEFKLILMLRGAVTGRYCTLFMNLILAILKIYTYLKVKIR